MFYFINSFLASKMGQIRGNRGKGWVATVAMYCHQYCFGGKYDLIQLHRQIIHENDGIFMRNWLKSSPPVFFYLRIKENN